MGEEHYLDQPLMRNNITRKDLDVLIDFLKQDDPNLTQSDNVREFEIEWSKWLGVRYSVFVNSGSSANLFVYELNRFGSCSCHLYFQPGI